MPAELADIGTVRHLAARHGVTLSKGYGQNFLIDPSVCPRIAAAARLDKDTAALEIGPGFGVLTRELAKSAGKTVAVEVDKHLAPVLAETLANDPVQIVWADFLELELPAFTKQQFGNMPVSVCANLPYYITTPILMKLLESGVSFKAITVMVQKEVAQRLSVQGPARHSSAIGLAVQYYAKAETLFGVPAAAFYPAPKVDSAVLQLIPHPAPPVAPKSPQKMFDTIRAAFSQRRKTAANAISAGLQTEKAAVEQALAALQIPAAIRPEQLSLQQFSDLADFLFK